MNKLHEMHIDVGCYVADALDSDERAAFDAHLADCESCSREVVEFSETSAELARLVAMSPPHTVRGSLLSAIGTVRPLPPLSEPTEEHWSLREERGAPTLRQAQENGKNAGALGPSTGSGTLSNDRRPARSSRRNRALTALIAAAAVIALALGGFVYNLQQQTDIAARAVGARQNDLLSAPDAKIYTSTRGSAQYSFVVSKQRNAALFIGTDLANPGTDMTYQLWTLQGRNAFPDALVDATTGSQWFNGPIDDSTSLAISIESAGGARRPTPPILAQVTI